MSLREPPDRGRASSAAGPVIAADRLSKRFFATRALDEVSMALAGGEVHALIGENGAGKSTLIKILAGALQPDGGTIRIDGVARRIASPRDALARGIVVIPQELRVVPAQTVAENVLLGHLPTTRALGLLPAVDRRRMRARTAEILGRLNLAIDPDRRVGALSFAERQLVMIARALSRNARVLILDEPTAALESREVARLFEVIGALKSEGVAIVFVSHRLEEVEAIGDLCTVLRDGRAAGPFRRGALGRDDRVRLMTGRDVEALHHARGHAPGELVLALRRDSGLALHRGEVLGMAGLLGSGTTEVLRELFGAARGAAEMVVKGATAAFASPADAIRHGVGLVPAERQDGLVLGLTVRENIVLPNLDRLSRAWRLDRTAIDGIVDQLMEALDIRPRDPGRAARELSGGNQQKVVFARWLAGHADVLLLDEPTHGIDVGAKAQIHRLVLEFAESGGAVVYSSSELAEVLSVADRVLAMRQGRIVAEMRRDGGDYGERALRSALSG